MGTGSASSTTPRPKTDRSPRRFWWLWVFVACFVVAVGMVTLPRIRSIITKSQLGENPEMTLAVVVSARNVSESRDHIVTYRYQTLSPEGQMTEYENWDHSHWEYNTPLWKAGDVIEIIYNPENPQISVINEPDSDLADWVFILCLPICGLLTFFGLLAMIYLPKLMGKMTDLQDETANPKSKPFKRPPSSPPPIGN